MAIIDQIKAEHLRNPETFKGIKELADSYILHIQEKEAYFLREKLTPLLEASDLENLQPELHKKYQGLIAQLEWAALPLLPDDDAMKTLQENYLMALESENIDALNRIEAKMFTVGHIPRNELRQKMQRALKENKELMGSRAFGEWLLDYSKTFDFRERSELTPSRYVNENSEAQTLSEEQKNKLKKALQIFDKTLLVTPIMSEPLFSMGVKEMIKGGTIPEPVNPTLLQTFSPPVRIIPPAPEKVPVKIKVEKKEEKPEPEPKPKPSPPTPVKIEEAPKEEEMTTYERKISPYERKRGLTPATKKGEAKKEEEMGEYQIRTMKQDIEKAKKKPIPEKSKAKNKNNILDLSDK